MAESLGYFKDPYCALLSKQRRKMFPVINRGTWARVHSIRQIIVRFVTQFRECNIISLGAGFDSTYWWLKSQQIESKVTYIEIDYPDVIKKKLEAIKSKPLLKEMITEDYLQSETHIDSPDYKLFAADVRDKDLVESQLTNVDKQLPTLVLTECLLVYMKATDSEQILANFAGLFSCIGFVNYEMIGPDDKFG